MGFSITAALGGAAEDWLKRDNLRINAASKDRERKLDEAFELKKQEIAHGYSIKYPVDQKWWSTLKQYGFNKLWEDKEIAKRTGTSAVPMAKMSWFEGASKLLNDRPEILAQN